MLDKSNENQTQEKLTRCVFSEKIKEQLIDDIVHGKCMPGERLIESNLAHKFGVSQAPVREALKSLAEMGFVIIEPYKGTTVRKMSKEEIWEMFTVRASLESFAAGICAGVITLYEIEYLEQLVSCMIDAAEEGDFDKRTEYNNKFHDEIIKISGHKLILKLSKSLRFSSWSHITGSHTSLDPVLIAKRHQAILEPLRTHDAKAAEVAMRIHIMGSLESVLKRMK